MLKSSRVVGGVGNYGIHANRVPGMDEATGDEHYLSLVPSTAYMSSPINIQYIYTIHYIPYIYTVYSIIYRRCVAHGL